MQLQLQEKQDVWQYLAATDKPIVLYGTGDGADKLFRVFDFYGIKVSDIFVSDEFYRGQSFREFECLTYSEVCHKYEDCIVVLAFAVFREDMLNRIREIGSRYEVLAPEVPVFGTDYFCMDTLCFYEREINNVFSLLADDTSKNVFQLLMEYKVSGKVDYLYQCETPRNEVFENIIRLGSQDSYLDLGAYRGDTIEEFLSLTNNQFHSIYALEPDIKNFKKMQETLTALSEKGIDTNRIYTYNLASWSDQRVLSFDGGGGRNSNLGEGKQIAHTTDIDSLLKGKEVTYVKMDVEGAEKETIDGMRNTLKQWKPALAISAYHRTGDLFTLPLQILHYNPDYKIFVRHHPYIPAWETNIYCN